GMEVHKYMNSNKFVEAEKYLTKSRAAAVFPELKYEAMYARARAGQGEFTDALGILSKLESRKHQTEFYLVDWVHGEVLYNQSLKTQDKTSMNQALEYLARARQVHFCGPRSDAIMSLMETIEHDLDVKVAKLNT